RGIGDQRDGVPGIGARIADDQVPRRPDPRDPRAGLREVTRGDLLVLAVLLRSVAEPQEVEHDDLPGYLAAGNLADLRRCRVDACPFHFVSHTSAKLVSPSMQFVCPVKRYFAVRTVKGAPMSDAEDRPDGRRTRGRQTQERIVDALLTLIEAGDPAPA